MRMTESEFLNEVGRLIGAFGEKAFSKDRLELIAGHVRGLPAFNFRRIVNHMVSTHRQAPLPKDFADAARAERQSIKIFDSGPAAKCKRCVDGYVSVIRTFEGRRYSYAYGCPEDDCPNRNQIPSDYPRASKYDFQEEGA